MTVSMGDALSSQVFLVELLASAVLRTVPMTHLTAVVFVRPTPANIAALARLLASPMFKWVL